MNKALKFFAVTLALLFLSAAALQYNDPDPEKWYVIYGVAAFASFLYAFGKLKLSVAIVLMMTYFGLALYFWPEKFAGVTMSTSVNIVNIEEGREALGVFIVGATMGIYAIFHSFMV